MTEEEKQKLIDRWLEHGFDLPVGDSAAFYSGDYWRRDQWRPYPALEGDKLVVRDYYPPAPEWHGFAIVLECMEKALGYKPKTLLDIGCGCGSLVAHARHAGIDAIGFDISQHAIDHPVPGAEGHIFLGDARTHPACRQADVVTATDLLEHIHEPYVDDLIQDMLRLAQRSVFCCICTARRPMDEWVHETGTMVPIDKAWLAVAGHVTIRSHSYWNDRFEALMRWEVGGPTSWRVDWKAMHLFSQEWWLHPVFKQLENWGPSNIMIASRL